MILPQSWTALCQCTKLEEIDAHWSSTLTAADWMQLAAFHRLRTLQVREIETEEIAAQSVRRALLDVGLVFPALIKCRSLRSLQLFGHFDLRTEHVALLAKCPTLENLKCTCLRIESLAPLSTAPALTELSFKHSTGLLGESINIREMIPSMALVESLTIWDPTSNRLTAAEAEPFIVALLQRLPKLVRNQLIQPLLRTPLFLLPDHHVSDNHEPSFQW